MHKLAIAAITTLLLTTGALAADRWGSIAFSPDTRANGYSYNYPSKAAAQSRAMVNCDNNADDCRIVVNFRNACGALAVGSNGGWGANWGTTRAAAENNALRVCRNNDDGCRVTRWVCSK